MTYPPLAVDVTGWLLAQLADLGARVGSKTPTDLQAEVPFVRVERAGGGDDGIAIDDATMTFHCFAASPQAANDLGHAVTRAVYALVGHAAAGAVVTQARKLSGPSVAPVADQNLAHAVVVMRVKVKTTG